MINSLDERKLRYDIQGMTIERLQAELAQLKPGSPSREAEFEKRLKAALNASPTVRFNSLYNPAQLKDHRAKMEAEIYFGIEQKRTLLAERLRPLVTKESLAALGDPKQDSAEFAKQLLRLSTSKTTATPQPPARPDLLELDRENETQTGKVTARLLCADYGISSSQLGRLLQRWHHGDRGHKPLEISTPAPSKLTREDVAKVRTLLTIWKQKTDEKAGK